MKYDQGLKKSETLAVSLKRRSLEKDLANGWILVAEIRSISQVKWATSAKAKRRRAWSKFGVEEVDWRREVSLKSDGEGVIVESMLV